MKTNDTDSIDIQLLDISPTAILILNVDGDLTFANKKARKVFGDNPGLLFKSHPETKEFRITDFEGNELSEEELPHKKVLLKNTALSNIEFVIEWSDGRKIYLSANAAPITNNKGITGLIVNYEDVSEKVRNENHASNTNNRYQNVFNNLIEEVHIWEFVLNDEQELINWKLIEANPVALKNWGKNLEEVKGKWATEIFGEEAIRTFKPIVEEILKTGKPKRWEKYFPATKQYLYMDSIPMGNQFISTGRDITELKNKERELRKLSLVAKKTQDAVIITDKEERIEWVNSAFESLTGYEFKEVIGKRPGKLLQGKETNPATVQRMAGAIERHEPFTEELINYHKSGKPYYTRISATPLFDEEGNLDRFFSIQQDLSQIKQIQDRLSNSVDRLEKAQDTAKIGDWSWDLVTGQIFWSDEVYHIYERDIHEDTPDYQYILEHSVDSDLFSDRVNKAIKNGQSYAYDTEIVTEKGNRKYVRALGEVETGKNKEILKLRGTVQDITERKKTELKLKEEEARISRITDSIDGVIMNYTQFPDGTGKINYISKGCKVIYGYSPKEVMNDVSLIWNNIPDIYAEAMIYSIQKSIDSLSKWSHIFEYRRPDGKNLWLHARGIPYRDKNNSTTFDTVLFDVTDLKKTERENAVLLQEVHHRVKNNLAIISGLLQLEEFQTEDEKLLLPLRRSRNRISSMAKVHELIYRDNDLNDVSLSNYVEDMVDIISENMVPACNVDVVIDIDQCFVNINVAVPLGLLLNELLTNSYKYAFKDREEGVIEIIVEKTESTGEIKVAYKDDGLGFKKGTNFEDQDTLGITLIKTLLSQLNAEYTVSTINGFSLMFDIFDKEKGSYSNLT